MTTRTYPARASSEVRDRPKPIEAGLAGVPAPDQRVIDEVYRRRARQLAARQAAGTGATTFAVLVFGLGTERYALDLSALAEVLPYRGCTAVPGAPPALLGVINLRGEIRCVADLRRILELPPGEDSASGYLLMVRQQGGAIGFKVDTIDHIRQVDPAQLLSSRDGAAPIAGSRFVKALTADTVILIDASAVLSHLLGPGIA